MINKYDSYKDAGVEWLGEIPEHWELTRLKNIFFESLEQNKDGKCKFNLSLLKDIGVIPFSEKGNKGNKSSLDTRNYRLVRKGDIVLNTTNVCIGSVGLSRYDGCMSSVMYIVLRPHVELNIKYYDYIFKVRGFQKYLRRISNGILEVREYLNKTLFMAEPMIIPPLPEQTAVAQFLDDKTTKIDEAIAIKQQQIALLKERKQILIHKAVTRGLNDKVALKDSGVEWIGEIPEHWEVKRLKFTSNLISEKFSSKESPLEYIGMENIESWTGQFVSSDSETDGLANYFDKGDVLFGKLRPYLAKVFLAEKEGICSTEFLVYRTGKLIYNWYLKLIMLSFEFINLIDSSTYGSKMPRANSEFIGNQLIPIPPLSEQKEIANYIETASAKIETAISIKKQEIEKLQEYKSSLINSVVTGKVRVC